MTHRGPSASSVAAWVAWCAGWVGVVMLAVAGAAGVELPAWVAAATALGGGAVMWGINTPRRP